jgi:hypothetical protein
MAIPKREENAPAITKEYIDNLQQQVYFLELELNLLKKITTYNTVYN